MSECPSKFSLMLWHHGDLPQDQAGSLPSHLEGCQACQAELETIRTVTAAFDEKLPQELARLEKSMLHSDTNTGAGLVRARPRRWGLALLGTLVAAAAAILVFVNVRPGLRPDQRPGPSPRGTISYRGALAWQVVVKRGDEQFALRSGGTAFPADALRFVLTTDRRGYLTVVALDQEHRLTALYPATDAEHAPRPLRITQQGRQVLPGSIILDNELGERHFVLVFAEQEFDRATVHRRLTQAMKEGRLAELSIKELGLRGSIERISVKKATSPL